MGATLFALVAFSLAGTGQSAANERHFSYTYESGVLPPGERELELWTTYRAGRHDLYVRLDHRAEFEIGLTNRLMTAFYLNWQDVNQEVPTAPSSTQRQFSFGGVSSEWKYKLSDPVADGFGSAVYGELGLGTGEVELEGKLILDKRVGKNLYAYNFTVEPEWEIGAEETELEEIGVENNLAFAHFFRPQTSAGLELRNHLEFTEDHKPEHIALFLGPVVSHAGGNWWVSATVLGQLPALKKSAEDPDSKLILDEHERVNARLLLSFTF
jgi:hypothetical protein